MDDRIGFERLLNFFNTIEFPLESLAEVQEGNDEPHTEISVRESPVCWKKIKTRVTR